MIIRTKRTDSSARMSSVSPSASPRRGEPFRSRKYSPDRDPSVNQPLALRERSSGALVSQGEGDAEFFPSSYTKHIKDPHFRPSSVSEFSKAFVRRFVSNTKIPPQVKNDFTGTRVVNAFSASPKTDVKCCAVGENQRVYVGNADGSISVFSRQSGDELKRTPQRESFVTAMLCVGDDVWAGFSDGFIRVLDGSTLSIKMNLSRHTAAVTTIVPQVGGHFVFTGSTDFTVLMWDATDCTYAGRFIGHSGGVKAIAVHYDRLYTAGDDCVIKVWDIYSKDQVDWKGHTASVKHLLIADGNLWSASDDGTIKVWNNVGKVLETLTTPSAKPITLLQQVGSTIWSSTMSQISVWDSCSRTLLNELKEHSNYIVAAATIAKSVVTRLWTISLNGEIVAWDHESELRGDDDIFAEEIKRRGEEVVCLRDALQDLQNQALELERQCNERVSRVGTDLDRLKEESEQRACRIADLESQLELAKGEVAKRDELLLQKDVHIASETEGKSVHRAMANHLQQTERKLHEAEAKISKLQAEIDKEAKMAERRGQRDGDTQQGKLLGKVQQSEVRQRELQALLDEANHTLEQRENQMSELKRLNAELNAKLDLSRKKIDEAQKLMASQAKKSQDNSKDREALEKLQKSLAEAEAAASATTASMMVPKSPSENDKGQRRGSADTKEKSSKKGVKVLPFLPPRPIVDRVHNYVRTVCLSAGEFAELPDVMREALAFETVRASQPGLDALAGPAADEYVNNYLPPDDAQEQLGKTLPDGNVDALTSQQQHALILSSLRLYNDKWTDMSREDKEEWLLRNGIFPNVIGVVSIAAKVVSSFNTISPVLRQKLEKALQRTEMLLRNPSSASQSTDEIDANATKNLPPPVLARLTRDLQTGWQALSYSHRRAIIAELVGPYFNDWGKLTVTEQRRLIAKTFTIPSLDELSAEISRKFDAKELPDTAVALLKVLEHATVTGNQGLMNSALLKLVDHGKSRVPADAVAKVMDQVNSSSPALSLAQLNLLHIDFVAQMDARFDDLPMEQAMKALISYYQRASE
jgi:WD40 repeat protein